jgi:SNF2 family DNA or RNA helicase
MSATPNYKAYINNYSSQTIRQRAKGIKIINLEISELSIVASVIGTDVYTIIISIKEGQIKSTKCSCPYDYAGICKHIVATLMKADEVTNPIIISTVNLFGEEEIIPIKPQVVNLKDYHISNFSFDLLTDTYIQENSGRNFSNHYNFCNIEQLVTNHAILKITTAYGDTQRVNLFLQDDLLTIACNCKAIKNLMCSHQAYALKVLRNGDEVRSYFDLNFKQNKLKEHAVNFGMEREENLEDYFELIFENGKTKIKNLKKGLMPITKNEIDSFKKVIPTTVFNPNLTKNENQEKLIIVIGKQYYHDYFFMRLMKVKLAKDGNIKNPISPLEAKQYLLQAENNEEMKFYAGIDFFDNSFEHNRHKYDLQDMLNSLKSVIKNPNNYPFYHFDSTISDNITTKSIEEVQLLNETLSLSLKVNQKDNFYEISPYIIQNGTSSAFSNYKLKFNFFLEKNKILYPFHNQNELKLLLFLKGKGDKLVIYKTQFEEFRNTFLNNLEGKVEIQYTYLKPATKKQLEENGFGQELKKIVYLKDNEDFVTITPVIKYAEREIPARNKMRLYALDSKGLQFEVSRDSALEARFIELIKSTHTHFEEQETEFEFFYLHKQRFLEDGWFLDAFEAWRKEGVEILGFNELKNNNYSPHKISTSVSISSGINWFDTLVDIKFGSEKVKLRDIQKAVYNQAKFIKLGDGKLGMLPDEWLEKYAKFFRSGEIHDNAIRSSKANFTVIDSLFEDEVLPYEVKEELTLFKTKFEQFNTIDAVAVPKKLKAKLRDYQKNGLNWLHFLDEFNFGGCLADDMGLGKTIQIISFILSLKEKNGKRTHLIVLPTSLIFNWQAELDKFAPSLKYHVIYGLNREKDHEKIDNYDIIITTYGTMLSDITFLKKINFDYIFLDESQAIKNPESKRYKAVRLLQSRNRIVLTGTPIENNTFDIYAQFSFANQALLGNQTHFKDNYAIPIDKFKDSKRAKELQQKLSPFLLRRTKKQVASELPDKTEIVMHCPMGENQRRIYETYRNEFKLFLEKADKNDELTNKNMHILQGLTKLRQICNSPELLNDEAFYGNESSKLDELLAQIEEKVGEHKILVFSQFVGMLELIRKRLEEKEITYEYLTGKTKDRSARVKSFQEDTEKRVFLISLKAGGTGLNLTEADYVFIVDPWWNPAVENQAIDRCYRIGQKKNVMAIRLICPDTIEDKILQLQAGKKELVEDLIKVDENAMKSLAKEDLMALLG